MRIYSPFDRAFQGDLPLPLSRLYTRTYHAKGERDRHDHAFHLVECALKIAAIALVARYKVLGERSPKVDGSLRYLAMPSLGQWRDIFRDTLLFLGKRPEGDGWIKDLLERLTAKQDDPRLEDIFAVLSRGIRFSGRRPERLSLQDLVDLLPAYRNAMSDAHGSIKSSPDAYREGTPALLELARILLHEKEANILEGNRLVFSEDVKYGAQKERVVVWMDLKGPAAIRREPFEGEPTLEELSPKELYLELGPQKHLSLYPLLHYQPGEFVDQVFILNRARGGKSGVQYLCYDTGDFYLPGKDSPGAGLVRDLNTFLAWATSILHEEVQFTPPPEEKLPEEEKPETTTRVFGDFELLEELGRGGMAVVYKARQRSLDRTVALKVLPPAFRSDSIAVSRFRQEVRALAKFDHPNVVKIFSTGEADGTYYYAMEFIDGANLGAVQTELQFIHDRGDEILTDSHFERAVTSAGGPSVRDIDNGLPKAKSARSDAPLQAQGYRVINFRLAAVIRDAARGLQHIHEHGFIHRDLKPQNIMITRERMDPVIMDLGLAKLIGGGPSITQDKTKILGTLRYMAPEQLQRNLLRIDHRADVYALGAVLYELTCFRPLLDGDTEERLTTQILLEEPLSPQKVNPRIPADLATIISKATQKNPKERYESAAELAEDLNRFLHGEAPKAKPPTMSSHFKRWVKRNRLILTSVSLVTLLLVTIFTAGGWYSKVSKSLALREEGEYHINRYYNLKNRLGILEDNWKKLKEPRTWKPPWEIGEELEAYYTYVKFKNQMDQHYNQAVLYYSNALEVAPSLSSEITLTKKALEGIYLERFRESQRGALNSLGPEYFRRMIKSLEMETYKNELEGQGKISFFSDPPGAEVYCFRYENYEEHLTPLPFIPKAGLDHPSRGLVRKPFLEIEEVRDSTLSPFATGDRILQVNGEDVILRGDVAHILENIHLNSEVDVKVLREGKTVPLTWVPFPGKLYPKEEYDKEAPLRPGRVVNFLEQFGFLLKGYPLDFEAAPPLGTTREGSPLQVELPKGSYLFVLRKAGYRDTRYPVLIPSEIERETIPLFRESEIPEGFIFVPAGSLYLGGDREADQVLDHGTVRVEKFFMKRLEVTFLEYLDFVNDREVFLRTDKVSGQAEISVDLNSEELKDIQVRVGQKVQLIPRDKNRNLLFQLDDKKNPTRWILDRPQECLDWPVLCISTLSAIEYAHWFTKKKSDGHHYRLPTDQEWERGARGADQRIFVWGDYPIWSFCNSVKENFHQDRGSEPSPAGRHPIDESVFQIRDMAGSACEPTLGKTTITFRYTALRGGDWNTTEDTYFRIANRNGRPPEVSGIDTGIRLVAKFKK